LRRPACVCRTQGTPRHDVRASGVHVVLRARRCSLVPAGRSCTTA
jgi:hypothetical protein